MAQTRALIASIMMMALIAGACGDDGSRDTAEMMRSPSNALDAEPVATPTLDLRNAVAPEEGMNRLLEIPNVGQVLQAIVNQDVERLLQLFQWQPQKCGLPRGHTEACPEHVEQYAELPMFNVGESVPFWVTAETLRPALAAILRDPVRLAFASRLTEPARLYRRESPRDIYYIGVEGARRVVGPSVIWGDATRLTGIFLAVDFASEYPIVGLATLSETWPAAQQAYAWGLEDHEIITYNP